MNPPNKPPPWNVPLVLHLKGKEDVIPTSRHMLGWHDGVRWCAHHRAFAPGDIKGWSLIDATTPKHDPDDLAELLALTHEHAHVNREPWTIKDAIEVVKELAREREAQWNEHDIGEGVDAAAYKTPEDLAKIIHESTRKHDVGLSEWDEQPEWARARGVAVAADVIDRLLRGGS